MKITITLPMNHPETTIRDLLEKEWLVPRKVRHFLRIRKTFGSINNLLCSIMK
ncbi:hypothetical protein ACIL82_05390 [Enterococcus faecium]